MRAPAALVALAGLGLTAGPAAGYEPTSKYRTEVVEGFTVLLSPELTRYRVEVAHTLRELGGQFRRFARVVPARAFRRLRGVEIWVEWDSPGKENVLARYFPGPPDKLGLNPDKAGGVEIPNIRRFLNEAQTQAAWVVLHELAHAYHHVALRHKDGAIEAAHKQAVDRRLYDDIVLWNGARGRGYAATNHWEYFATLSEAYFGKSYDFPFDREGLRRHDVVGYRLMRDAWGEKE